MLKSISILIFFSFFCIFKITSAIAITILSCEGDAIETFHEDLHWTCKNCLEKKKFKSKFTVIFDNQHIEFISNTLPDRNIKLGMKHPFDGYENYEIENNFVYYYYSYTYDRDNIGILINTRSDLSESLYIDRLNGKFEYNSNYLLERNHNYKKFYWEKKFGKGTDKSLTIKGKCKKSKRAF